MQKGLLAGAILTVVAILPARAADVPPYVSRAPVVAPVPLYGNWSGLYFGGNLGGMWTNESDKFVNAVGAVGAVGAVAAGTRTGLDRPGFIGGGQVGFNWQTGPWVAGAEGDMDWSSAQATRADFTGTVVSTSRHHWYTTLTGRLGYAWANWLIYGKAGGAWMNSTYGLNVATATINDTRSGWTAGVGLEWAMITNWSAKVEYDYLSFGTDRLNFTGVTSPVDFHTDVHLVKFGFNYRFVPTPPPPLVTRY